jgi:hypothetical protein
MKFDTSELLKILAHLSLEGETFEICRAALKLQVALQATQRG